MKKCFVNKDEFKARLDMASYNKQPYELLIQGNSKTLNLSDGSSYYLYSLRRSLDTDKIDLSSDRLPANEIYFIGKVKNYIIDNGFHKSIGKNYNHKDMIKFISYNENIGVGEFFDDSYCIDITVAYWRSAYNQGYLSKSLYEKGLTVDKRVRLACLGTFAKTVSVINFDGENEYFGNDIKPKFEHVFFNAANLIYKCMNACRKAVKDDFIFYWTDCVYVKNKEAVDICKGVMIEHGFDSHYDYCERISFEHNGIRVNKWSERKGKFEDKFYGIMID